MPRIDTIVVHAGPQGPTGPTGTNIYVQPGDPGSVPDGTLWLDTDDTTPDTSLNWGNIAGTLSNQTDLNTALAAKAPLASPALTGTPTAPTAAPGTNTTQIATTAYVAANAATNPLTTKGDLYGYGTTGARVPVGTDGQVLVADSTQATGLGYATRAAVASYLLSGSTFGPLNTLGRGGNGLNLALTANTLYLVPCFIPEAMTLTAIGIGVTVASTAGNARVGIFTMVNTTKTETLVLDAGTFATATTGNKSLTISQAMTAGMYWLGIVVDVACSVNAFPAAGGFSNGIGNPVQNYSAYVTTAMTYGAFAGPYGPFTVAFNLSTPPNIEVKRS